MEEGHVYETPGRLMSRQQSEIQNNNNTCSDWTKCTVKLSLLSSPTRSELNSDLACGDKKRLQVFKDSSLTKLYNQHGRFDGKV